MQLRVVSGAVGILGGLVDLLSGYLMTQPLTPARPDTGMMGGSPSMMMAGANLPGTFLLLLGIVVLVTGAYALWGSGNSMNMSLTGSLMLVYGLIMLVVGAMMLGNFFFVMMQGSAFSGAAMLILGILMLASGGKMLTRKM